MNYNAVKLVDDGRTQDQARTDFIRDMDEDKLVDLRNQIMMEVFDLLMNDDAIGALRVHDRFFDKCLANMAP